VRLTRLLVLDGTRADVSGGIGWRHCILHLTCIVLAICRLLLQWTAVQWFNVGHHAIIAATDPVRPRRPTAAVLACLSCCSCCIGGGAPAAPFTAASCQAHRACAGRQPEWPWP
jgi:hypothetical protein